jgi:hypothetical protein
MPKKPLYVGKINEKTVIVGNVLTDKINTEILIESLLDAHLTYEGQISGKPYEWMTAGSITPVLEEDVPALLEKRLGGNPCCGSDPTGNKIFQVYTGR